MIGPTDVQQATLHGKNIQNYSRNDLQFTLRLLCTTLLIIDPKK